MMKLRPMLTAVAVLCVAACGPLSAKQPASLSSSGNSAAPQRSTVIPPPPASTASAPQQSALLAGNAHPKYRAGTPGRVSVVYQAPIKPEPVGTLVPIVFRNGTSTAIAHVTVSATAEDQDGKIVASGASQGTDPSVVQPGQWAFAFIYFEPGSALAVGNTLSFTFQSMPASTEPFNTAAIQVTQANLSGSSIVGGVKNTTGSPVQGPVSVHAYCLDPAGRPVSAVTGFTTGSLGDLAPNDTGSFQLTPYDQDCSSFLVGASGYYK
jgi:hypothetical protein